MKTKILNVASLCAVVLVACGGEPETAGAAPTAAKPTGTSSTTVACSTTPAKAVDVNQIARTWKIVNDDFFCPAASTGECHMGRKLPAPVPDPGNPIDYFLRITTSATAGEFNLSVVEIEPAIAPDRYPATGVVGQGTLRQRDPAKAELCGDILFRHWGAKENHFVTVALRDGPSPLKPLKLWIEMRESESSPVPSHDGTGHAED